MTWTGLSAKTLSYGYYPNGSRQIMTTPAGNFYSTYDGAGRLTTLRNPSNELQECSYLGNGWLNYQVAHNAVFPRVYEAYTAFNARGQITRRDTNYYSNPSATLTYSHLTYDGAGNRTGVTSSLPNAPASYSGTTSYGYDYGQTATPALNRSQLTSESSTRNGGYTNAFGYDATAQSPGGTSSGPGNPTSFKGGTNAFNVDNQITNTGFVYDGNGNLTTYHGQLPSFDPENRLTQELTGGFTSTCTYDGDGHQVIREAAAHGNPRLFTYHLYDGDTLVSQYSYYPPSNSLTLSTTDTVGADGLVSVYGLYSNASTFYAFDERGNVAQRLGSSGALLSSDLYDAFGARTSTASGNADFVGFGGQWGYFTDYYLGLILCTHRYYDPSLGRFVTRDPMGYGGGINLYGYTGNSPINRIDPLGLQTIGVGINGTISAGPVVVGVSGGIKGDRNGTVGISCSLFGIIRFPPGMPGPGVGPGGSFSPGNLPVDDNGITSASGGFSSGPVGYLPPVGVATTSPTSGGPPTISVFGSTVPGFGYLGSAGGTVGINVPGLIQAGQNLESTVEQGIQQWYNSGGSGDPGATGPDE